MLVDLHRTLGADCFSRNLATDQLSAWYGGFTEMAYQGIQVEYIDKSPTTRILYHTAAGDIEEEFFYHRDDSTLVQTKFLLDIASIDVFIGHYLRF
jgi:hypothetical protein